MLLLMLSVSAAANPPLIIGHRGASGHRPEHTLASYRLAAEMGADFIEPDLVATKDGVLIARHENEIGGTTDVANKFADRKRTKTIDDQSITGWFSEDFTLAEIKTLRARERLAFRSHDYDGRFEIPTFDEVVALAQQLARELGRPIGVYPETKHPTYFRGIDLPLEPPLLRVLEARGWNTREAPVFIQSFETANLRELRTQTKVRLVQLVDRRGAVDDAALKTIATYADGLGPEKSHIVPTGPDGALLPTTDLVNRAHAAGLIVHAWTVRSDKEFLPAGYKGRVEEEFERLRAAGVDGVFTDFPDAAARVYKGSRR